MPGFQTEMLIGFSPLDSTITPAEIRWNSWLFIHRSMDEISGLVISPLLFNSFLFFLASGFLGDFYITIVPTYTLLTYSIHCIPANERIQFLVI